MKEKNEQNFRQVFYNLKKTRTLQSDCNQLILNSDIDTPEDS